MQLWYRAWSWCCTGMTSIPCPYLVELNGLVEAIFEVVACSAAMPESANKVG